MSPENQWLEAVFPIEIVLFFGGVPWAHTDNQNPGMRDVRLAKCCFVNVWFFAILPNRQIFL